jgi:hypothetical protein
VKIIIILSLLFCASKVFCQNYDELPYSTKKVYCFDISYNASLYFANNDIDSAKTPVEYREQKCGISEPVFRARILLALMERNFSDSILPDETFLQNYKMYLHNYYLFTFKIKTFTTKKIEIRPGLSAKRKKEISHKI